MNKKSPRFPALLALSLLACSGGDDDDGGPDAGNEPITLRGTCDEADHIGAFQVAVSPDFSSVDGQVFDAVLPVTIRDEVSVEGDCRLMRRLNLFCDPACSGAEVCDHDGTCKPQPAAQDVGVVTVTGLEEPISMEPRPPGNNYFATPATNPIFLPGAEIRLRTEGGAYVATALGGFGFEPLSLTASDWSLAAAQPLAVTWAAPASADDKTRITLEVTINQHGTSPVALECDFPDNGSATIPASVIDALLAEGVSGFPSGIVKRVTRDRATVSAGCIDLTVASPIASSIDVDGHTPCDGDEDCTAPQTCDIPNETCVD